MWSMGNEIREQDIKGGEKLCRFLVDISKREDPSRPTTAGLDKWQGAIKNGFGDIVDVPGWNYKPQHYNFIHQSHPTWKMYGSETASTVSSRGEYFFPAEEKIMYQRDPQQCSSYDLEYPSWATTPDVEFAAQDSLPFMAGEFVWTGFDYLGEPTPYNQWPSRSSYFGIIDLAGFPKDRYYLYQSRWSDNKVLHLLPHWNWEGMEGKPIPVHCYTNYQKAELFVNGKSMGIREKDPKQLHEKYRLVWNEVPYEPGELKAVALNSQNKPQQETIIRTSGKPFRIVLNADRKAISYSQKELAFVTAIVVDEHGIACPKATNRISFKVNGDGVLKATDNGNPTDLESFASPDRNVFNGKCAAIIKSANGKGKITLRAESKGLIASSIVIEIKDE
jgi:beta-galactosidase